MQYRHAGASGLQLSAVSIGGWLTFGGSIKDSTTSAILKAALDAGINFIDLADIYAKGAAEEAAGRALASLPRHEFVISSKVFARMSAEVNDAGLSRKHIMESCERSLKRLGTDYLDIYFCHREDPGTPLEETVMAMDDLVRQGKILYWGSSCWTAGSLRRSHDLSRAFGRHALRLEQPQYNLLTREIEADVLPAAEELGIGLVIWSPLAGGALTGKYDDGIPTGSRGDTGDWIKGHLSEANLERLRAFSGIARDMGCEPGQLALAWILRHSAVSSVITGATDPSHVVSNAKAVEIVIPDDVLARLDELFPAPASA